MAAQSNSKSNKAKVGKVAPAAKPVLKPAKPGASFEPTQEEIQARAFEIYVSEGCKEGSDLENWLRAEQELRSR
jgi:hypothetical protein